MQENNKMNFRSLEKEEIVEVTIERSLFIGLSFRVQNQNEIHEKVKATQLRFPDATHHCYGWRLGGERVREFSTDAGEPRGTAGRPILGVLRRHELWEVLIMVVRYFGGKKLGAKGLTAAYGYTTDLTIQKSGTREFFPSVHFTIHSDPVFYPLLVNQLIAFTRRKEGVHVDPQSLVIHLSLPLSRKEATLDFLEKELREKRVISYSEMG
ncbi:MAG: YigZ family protein, partial [Atribacterota bacterium]